MMCGDHTPESILKFWSHLKTLPAYKYHDVLHSLTDCELKKTVPFAIHGDGAEFHRHSEYFVMSWTSAFITGGGENCLVSRYPISLVAEAQMADDRDPWLRFMHKRTNNENPQLISGILRLVFNPASSVVDLKTGLLWWDSLVVKDRKKHCKIRVSFFPFNPTRK